jgi:predicted MFS family arabinose efflux permease
LFRRPSRTTTLTATATALSLLGDQALYALLPLYFQEIGLVPIQVGILLSANRWIRLFTNHLAERIVGCYPAHLMLAASLTLGALLTAVYAAVSSFLILLIARCLWGLCWSFIRHIAVMGVAASSDPQDLGQMMGYYNGISRIGSVVGIVLGGILFDLFGFTTTLVAFCLASLLAVPFALSSGIQSVGIYNAERKASQPGSAHHALLTCGFCIGAVGPGLIMSTLGFILLSRYGQQVDLYGILLGVATLNGLLLGCRWILDTLGAPVYGALIDRAGLHVGAPVCFFTGVIVLMALTMDNSLAALAAGIILFFMSGTALTTVVSAEASRRGPRIYARYASAGDLGAAFGPVIGWTAYELLDVPDLAFFLGALIYAVGLLSALAAFKRPAMC